MFEKEALKINESSKNFSNDTTNRRLSTRPIKRKKFDDELVESSLKNERTKGKFEIKNLNCSLTTNTKSSYFKTQQNNASETITSNNNITKLINETDNMVVGTAENTSLLKKTIKLEIQESKPTDSKKIKKTGLKHSSLWTPQDDLLLILSVHQTCDLNTVHIGVKFNRNFTLNEIKERWYCLLYNSSISKSSLQAIKSLHPDEVTKIQKSVIFTKSEERLLYTIPADSNPNIEIFEKLLQSYTDVFYLRRTAKCLFNHWLLMKEFDLLPINEEHSKCKPKNYYEATELLRTSRKTKNMNRELKKELQIWDMEDEKEIDKLESDINQIERTLHKHIDGISSLEFTPGIRAILKGKVVQYSMESNEIVVGRNSRDQKVDVDLSMEGPAHKVSRKHFIIKEVDIHKNKDARDGMNNEQLFKLINLSKRPVYVDGNAVTKGVDASLLNGSNIEISCLRLTFYINLNIFKC